MGKSVRRVALVGSWADAIDDRRSVAGELAAAWSNDDRISVFADAAPRIREHLASRGVSCWPEGAFGRHFARHEFDHAILMLGARLDSILALGRAADEGCHVWLQDDVVDIDGSPIDAPADWLADVIASARSVIVGSDWVAGVVRRLSSDGPPVLVMPPAHPNVDPVVDTPERSVIVVGDDEKIRRVTEMLTSDESIRVTRLDTDMTPEERTTRLLSARAAVKIRSSERGHASTTVTHMTARGIPTITNLTAHSPFAGDDLVTSGLVVVDHDDRILTRVMSLLGPILDDDRQWLAASTAAKATAARWTWADAADVLAQWIDVVDGLDPSTVRVVGAVAP